MLMHLPGVGTVDASDEHAKALLDAGWRPVTPDEGKRDTAPKRRTRKAAIKPETKPTE